MVPAWPRSGGFTLAKTEVIARAISILAKSGDFVYELFFTSLLLNDLSC